MKTFIVHIKFMFFFLFIIIILSGCGKSEKEKVDNLNRTFKEGNYRKVIRDYKKLITELDDSLEIKRANKVLINSQKIVVKADSLISLADSLSNYGFNLPAIKYVKDASNLLPRDSIINNIIKNIPQDKNPKYKISGIYRSAKFSYIFHTKWLKEELVPVSVDITVTNLSSYSATALGFYVPSFYFLEVENFGYRFFIVVANPEKWGYSSMFNKPIFYNQSLTGNVTYSDAEYHRENTNISLATVFKNIIFGKDARFYLNIAGTKNTRFSGMKFIGYE